MVALLCCFLVHEFFCSVYVASFQSSRQPHYAFPLYGALAPPPPLSNVHAFVSQLKASLAEQLSVEQLREEFRTYITTKVAEELVDFYLDSLDREEIVGFFERQVTFKLPFSYYCTLGIVLSRPVSTHVVFIGKV